MPNPIVNGTLSPVRQPDIIEYDPVRGYVRQVRYACANVSGLAGTALQFQNARYAYNHTLSLPSEIVGSATSPETGADITTDTWQILANEINKDIKEHPTFLRMEELYPGTIQQVVADVENLNPVLTAAVVAGATTDAGELFKLLIRGTTHYATTQYVLKHTTTVANNYAINVADLHVNKLYTSAQLLTETQSTSSWAYPLPGRLAYKINQIPAPASRVNYLWSWRKLASTETTAANGRIEISTEYWLDQWSMKIYDSKT